MDSPLNLAHQEARRADIDMKFGKFEDAIICHKRAAEHILDAMQLTASKHALESLQLQHRYHLKEQDFIRGRQRKAELTIQGDMKAAQITEPIPKISPLKETHGNHQPKTDDPCESSEQKLSLEVDNPEIYKTMAETDSLLQYLANRRYGNNALNDTEVLWEYTPRTKSTEEIVNEAIKSPKGEKTVIEELRIHTEELRKHICILLKELETSKSECAHLHKRLEQSEQVQTYYLDDVDSEDLKLPSLDLPPLEMPHFDFDSAKDEISKLSESQEGQI